MTETKTYKLPRDGEPDLRITGELLAEVSNHSHQGSHQNRWTEICLYRTKAGKHVVSVIHRSQWEGEGDTHRVAIAGSPLELLGAMEGDVVDLVKEALAEAGIEAAEDLE